MTASLREVAVTEKKGKGRKFGGIASLESCPRAAGPAGISPDRSEVPAVHLTGKSEGNPGRRPKSGVLLGGKAEPWNARQFDTVPVLKKQLASLNTLVNTHRFNRLLQTITKLIVAITGFLTVLGSLLHK